MDWAAVFFLFFQGRSGGDEFLLGGRFRKTCARIDRRNPPLGGIAFPLVEEGGPLQAFLER